MSPDLRVIVYPPDAEGGRRVRVDGEILGRALGPNDLFEFLRRAGLDPDDVDLADELFIEWRGGGPAVWSNGPDTE
uniref:SLV.8 n=1 Tax=Streptomyces lavendulae TaxID=1914 RepID=Q6RGR2_STRLA|nr:SLV.8 [Streptomyces lavendulae]